MNIAQKLKSFIVVKEQNPKQFEIAIRGFALQHGLEPEIVAAVILQESGGNPYAFRYENGFYERYLANKLPASLGGKFTKGISLESEIRLRAFSFGLMQIMGQTARENGFEGYLPELFDPNTNIELGCKILSSNLKYYKGDYRKALSAYNSGRGLVDRNGVTPYAEEVIGRVDKKEISKLLTT